MYTIYEEMRAMFTKLLLSRNVQNAECDKVALKKRRNIFIIV
jgi:hypothetical protein